MLDLNTLRLISMVNFAGFAFVTVMLWRLVPQERSLRDWAIAPALLAIGMLLLGFRGVIPNFLSIVIANTVITLGVGFMHQGARRLFSLSTQGSWKWIAAGATFFICLVTESPAIRIVWTSLIYIPFLLALAWLFWQSEEEAPLKVTKRIASLVYAVGVCLFTYRAIYPPIATVNVDFVATPSLIEALPYLYSILISLWISLTLMLIVSVRLQFQRAEALKRSEASIQALNESHQQTHSLLNSMAEGTYGVDVEGNCTFVNKAFLRILGYDSSDEVIGKQIHDLIHYAHADGSPYPASTCLMDAVRTSPRNAHSADEVFWHKDGTSIQVEYWVEPIVTEGKLTGAVATFVDIAERKRMEDQIRQLAFFDSLTNLPNRRMLHDRLNQAMAASKRSNYYGALMFIDLDNFKPLNDTHGHEVGDLLLVEVAIRLKKCVREMDTVARFGGDEFVVMLCDLNENKSDAINQARLVSEKILEALSAPYVLHINHLGDNVSIIEHRCTASIGVAMFNDHQSSQDDILKWADTAMYQAKEAGRNSIKFYAI